MSCLVLLLLVLSPLVAVTPPRMLALPQRLLLQMGCTGQLALSALAVFMVVGLVLILGQLALFAMLLVRCVLQFSRTSKNRDWQSC